MFKLVHSSSFHYGNVLHWNIFCSLLGWGGTWSWSFLCAPNETFCTPHCSVPHMLTTTFLLPHSCQPALRCKWEQRSSLWHRCGIKWPSASVCSHTAQWTAATVLTKSRDTELHRGLYTMLAGSKWYLYQCFLLCVRELYCVFDCVSWFPHSWW